MYDFAEEIQVGESERDFLAILLPKAKNHSQERLLFYHLVIWTQIKKQYLEIISSSVS
jgi:hypothetical protein